MATLSKLVATVADAACAVKLDSGAWWLG